MFGTTVSSAMLEKSMSALWKKNQLVMNNIANEDTPGYKAKRINFEDMLKKELNSATNVTAFGTKDKIARIENLEPRVYDDKSTSVRADGNNVNIDSENIELARIQIQWNALTRKISGHYSTLKYAVTGGR